MEKIFNIQDLMYFSRLNFSDQEKERIEKDLKTIIEYISKFDEYNLENVEELKYINAKNFLRDEIDD